METKQWAITFLMFQVKLGNKSRCFDFSIKFLSEYYLQLFACTVNVCLMYWLWLCCGYSIFTDWPCPLWTLRVVLHSDLVSCLLCALCFWYSVFPFAEYNIYLHIDSKGVFFSVCLEHTSILSQLICKAKASKGIWTVVWLDLAYIYR